MINTNKISKFMILAGFLSATTMAARADHHEGMPEQAGSDGPKHIIVEWPAGVPTPDGDMTGDWEQDWPRIVEAFHGVLDGISLEEFAGLAHPPHPHSDGEMGGGDMPDMAAMEEEMRQRIEEDLRHEMHMEMEQRWMEQRHQHMKQMHHEIEEARHHEQNMLQKIENIRAHIAKMETDLMQMKQEGGDGCGE